MRASAPGKLMLFGEYAVLEGATALMCAVDRRARVSLEPMDASGRGELVAPQLGGGPFPYRWEDGRVRWQYDLDDLQRLSLARRLIETLDQRSIRIVADTSAYYEGPRKLGLGSSAALTVAWVAAAERPVDMHALHRRARSIHRAFQQGRGSGADIAASCFGGVFAYRNGTDPSIEPVRWPDELHWVSVWTGRSADTRAYLEKLSAWSRSEPRRYAKCLDRLANVAERAASALQGGVAGDLVGLATDYRHAMARLGRAAGMEIISSAHAELARLADRCGVAYKPSGAGGGDFGLALSDDPDRLQTFRDGLALVGARPVSLQIDAQGVTLEADSQP